MFSRYRRFRIFQLLFVFLLALSILSAPAAACSHAALALQLWFERMIPSLFPFMILSGLIVRLHLDSTLSIPVYPIVGRLYRINRNMCTAMLLGFLFGFPLGAKTVAEQYRFGRLSKPQAQYLLTFCNNIGPVYLLSFALPLLGLSGGKSVFLLLYFGIPLLYGLVLRYTVYHGETFSENQSEKARPFPLRAASQSPDAPAFIPALDDAVTSACGAIAKLGGYMVFFMVCNTLPEKISLSARLRSFFAILLEITSGLSLSKDILPLPFLLTMLTFGGFSCFAQSYTCIRETDLSFSDYCFHKMIQTAIAFCLYTLFFVFYC